MRTRWELFRALPVVYVIFAAVACGKKGPLLPPYVRQPAAAEVTAAKRVGNDVYVTLKVPAADIDGATPASLASIEIYAVTAEVPPPPGAGFLAGATLVTSIPVARAGAPGDRSGTVVPDPKTGALQGATVTIHETLTAEKLEAREPPAPRGTRPSDPPNAAAPSQPRRRFYMALALSDRKRQGPFSAVVEVPLTFVPDRVPAVRAAMSGHDVELQWEPSGGVIGWLLDRPLALEVPSAPVPASTPGAAAPPTPPTSGPTLYNVYLERAPDPLALTATGAGPLPWASTAGIPINPQPIAGLTFTDADVPFDERMRCYQVRAVRGTGAQQVESESSDRACIVPVDLEPPTAPTGLTATVGDGSVTLQWEPNGEEDLRGYVVLRREGADDTLLTRDGPTTETRFTDSTVMPGRMYTYIVQAVDNRIPLPNVSDPRETTVTAR